MLWGSSIPYVSLSTKSYLPNLLRDIEELFDAHAFGHSHLDPAETVKRPQFSILKRLVGAGPALGRPGRAHLLAPPAAGFTLKL